MCTCSASTGPYAGSTSPSAPGSGAYTRRRNTLPSTTTRGGQVITQIKTVVATGVLALSLAATAGCGGGNNSSSNANTTATTSTTQTTTTPSGGGGGRNLTISA